MRALATTTRAHCFGRDLDEFRGPGFLCNHMNFRRRRLASVLGLEVCDSLFDLTAPLRIFFAQLVRNPIDLKTFELAPLIEFIARTIGSHYAAGRDRFSRRSVSP